MKQNHVSNFLHILNENGRILLSILVAEFQLWFEKFNWEQNTFWQFSYSILTCIHIETLGNKTEMYVGLSDIQVKQSNYSSFNTYLTFYQYKRIRIYCTIL